MGAQTAMEAAFEKANAFKKLGKGRKYPVDATCCIEGCTRPVHCHNICKSHYNKRYWHYRDHGEMLTLEQLGKSEIKHIPRKAAGTPRKGIKQHPLPHPENEVRHEVEKETQVPKQAMPRVRPKESSGGAQEVAFLIGLIRKTMEMQEQWLRELEKLL